MSRRSVHATSTLAIAGESLSRFDPALATEVVKGQDVAERPVEMVGDRGYLLLQTLRGVA